MPISLKTSNSLESLAKELSDNLRTEQKNVFTPYMLITQTDGMNNWLRLQLAAHLGIAANLRFLKSNDLIFLLYQILKGPHRQALSGQSLVWLLYELLGKKDFINRFPLQAQYFTKGGSEKDIKRMELAEKAADLFDQYQIYRPEMIRKWNATALNELRSDEWQAFLWIKAGTSTQHALPDKTQISNYILDAIKDPSLKEKLKRELPVVNLFGLSIITTYHIHILFELSAIIDVNFYIINPAPDTYWYEDRSEQQLARWQQKFQMDTKGRIVGNPLLTNWGKVLQDTFSLFFKQDEFLNRYEAIEVVLPKTDSLLHKIQNDIYENRTSDRNQITAEDLVDGSISISSCYTIAREVEVLYNYLVNLVNEQQGALSTRDIIVMASNIDAYVPYIKAIFNNAPYPFRYSIADETVSVSDNIYHALETILSLNENDLKAERVLQLLDSGLIKKRFRITDTGRIRSIVDAANIRFGIDGNKEDDTYLVSWRYGIKRIMYGICMSDGMEYGTGADSFYPLDLVEGQDVPEIIRFCHFIEVLISSIEERSKDRSIAEWVQYVERVLQHLMYEPEEDGQDDYNELITSLSRYNEADEFMSGPVSFRIFCHSFLKTLGKTTRASLFANGGITFCSLIPMRSIPFKIVAMLGLNYDAFPRRERPSGFNLMEQDRQIGDRNIRGNDKHLFLETIVSAQEYLHISYLGRSVKDNSELPPSALVGELIDYISSGVTGAEDVYKELVVQHPLHGFSARYNKDDVRLYSYLINPEQQRNTMILQADKEVQTPDFETIRLADLAGFFKHPIRSYYNKALDIYYRDTDILLAETELFHLDHLQEWGLKSKLLHLPDEAEALSELQRKLIKTGALPLKNMAGKSIRDVSEAFAPVRELFKDATNGLEASEIALDIEIDGNTLNGILHNVFDGILVCTSWSGNDIKYMVDGFVRYLAGVASEKVRGMIFISGKNKAASFHAQSLSPEAAREMLTVLVALYKKGVQIPMVFMPEVEMKPETLESLTTEILMNAIRKEFFSEWRQTSDPYLIKAFQSGLFEQMESVGHYRRIYHAIIIPMHGFFPEYFSSTISQQG